MKATFGFSALLALLQLANGQPYREQHHRHQHAKREAVQYKYQAVHRVAVIVYVDAAGKAVSTSTSSYVETVTLPVEKAVQTPESQAAEYAAPPQVDAVATPAPYAPQAPEPAPEKAPEPAPKKAPEPAPEKAPEPAPEKAPEPAPKKAPEPAPEPASAPGSGYGISYTPYTANQSGCKSKEDILADFQKMADFSTVRIYGHDCMSDIVAAAKSKGIKLFAGIYDIKKVREETDLIIKAVGGSWGSIDTVGVGNELVNFGKESPAAVTAAIGQARQQLRAAGYQGPVVTVDTFVALIANPELCRASDYAAANCHAFFDGGVEASGAGEFVANQAKRVSEACGGKRVVITESGWPSQGIPNRKAVPSRQNQQIAIASLRKSFSSDLYFFSAFNEEWKKDTPETFNCEKYWGIL